VKKKQKKGNSSKQKINLGEIGPLLLWGMIVAACGASLSIFLHRSYILCGFILLLFWFIFSFTITRLRLVKDYLYSTLLNDAKTYLPFLLFLTFSHLPLIWQTILSILITGVFLFLKASIFEWEFAMKDISQRISWSILISLTLLYVVNYSYLSIIQYNALFTGHWDLAGFDQAIWNTIHGRILHTTMYGHNFLGEHMSPILILLAPFYLIWEDPRMLLILQSLFLGLGAIPVYLIAKDKLKHNLLSLSFSFAYLFHPFISRVNLIEFHEICLAPFFLLFTFYFLQRKRWWLYSIFLFLSLMVKEDVSLIITALGIYAFFRVNKKAGIITLLIGISWAYLCVSVLMPYIKVVTGTGAKEVTYSYFSRYTLGSTSQEIIKNLILKPQDTLKMLFLPANEKMATLILLNLPLGFLSILSSVILIALPEIILHFMAPWATQYLLIWHYSAPIIPFAIVSGIYGSSFMLKKRKGLSIGFALYLVISSISSNYYFGVKTLNSNFYSPSYYIIFYDSNKHKTLFSFPKKNLKIYYQTERKRRLFETLKQIIPKETSISAQDNLLAHFSQTKASFYVFPEFKETDYVILNNYGSEEGWFTRWGELEEYKKGVDTLFQDTKFQIFFRDNVSEGGIVIFAKKERKDEIIRNAKRLVRENPKSTYTHFILGSIYAITNNLIEAKEEFKIALRLDSENPFAKQMLEECKFFLTSKNKLE
jgi:uncharacterized membrane protein